jgi:NhaP-type Na+/H+ or K+/H+ antiporter
LGAARSARHSALTELNLTIALIGGLVLVLGLVSDWLKQHGISDVLVALALGVAVGPVGLGLLNPLAWSGDTLVLEEAARLTIGIGLMGAALRLPGGYFGATWRSQAVLLLGAMAGMWLVSGLLVWGVLGVQTVQTGLIGNTLDRADG